MKIKRVFEVRRDNTTAFGPGAAFFVKLSLKTDDNSLVWPMARKHLGGSLVFTC